MTRRRAMALVASTLLSVGSAATAMAADASPSPGSIGPSVGQASLEGTTWLLARQAMDGRPTPLPDGILVTLIMSGGQAGGSGGCNSYFASYSLEGESLTFSQIGSTLMACPGPADDVERAYFENLAAVATWTANSASLTLSDGSSTPVLEFEVAPEPTLVGNWVAEGINDGQEAVVSSETTSLVTADFDAQGRVTGSDGCNRYFTSYTVDGERITISDLVGTTRMACESDELAQQSEQYFAALAAASTWSIDATGNLELRDDDGALQVRFKPAEG